MGNISALFLSSPAAAAATVAIAVPLLIYIYSVATAPGVDYRGKHVLITGGSQGIGFEAAKEYIRRGANVTIVARKPEAAVEELTKGRVSESQKIQFVAVDISSGMEAVQAAFDPVIKEVGDVHTILNSAGISEARWVLLSATIRYRV